MRTVNFLNDVLLFMQILKFIILHFYLEEKLKHVIYAFIHKFILKMNLDNNAELILEFL